MSDGRLPCDVLVQPATLIKRGCKIETLLECIELRRERSETGPPFNDILSKRQADELTALRSQVSELRADLEVAVNRSWEILKQRCCADPKKAKRCVMVSKDDFRAALLKDPDAKP